MSERLSNEQAAQLCKTFQELLPAEKCALLGIPEVREELQRVLIALQEPSRVRRIGALNLARAVSYAKYGKNNEAELFRSLGPQMISFLRWIGLRSAAEKRADHSSSAYKNWALLDKQCIDIRNQLIVSFGNLIPRVRIRIGRFSAEMAEDLDSEGLIGLAYAVEKYDGSKGKSFAGYAELWIKEKMMAALSKSKVVSLPQQAQTDLNEMKRRINDLTVQLRREPTEDELEELAGIDVNDMHRREVSFIHLDAPTASDDRQDSVYETLADDSAATAVDMLRNIDRRAYILRLSRAIFRTKPQERIILMARVGGGLVSVSGYVPRPAAEAKTIAIEYEIRAMAEQIKRERRSFSR